MQNVPALDTTETSVNAEYKVSTLQILFRRGQEGYTYSCHKNVREAESTCVNGIKRQAWYFKVHRRRNKDFPPLCLEHR